MVLQIKVLLDTATSKLWIIDNYSPDIYSYLKDISLLEEPPIMIMGKECRQRRDVGFFSNKSIGYRYSGQIMSSTSLDEVPVLKHILPEINKSLGTDFNGILVNRYINGEKYIGAHSDDEKGLDKQRKMVASIAYGPGIRTFRIRNKQTKEIVLDYQHTPCTLLVMEGNFQKEFTHEIPIQKKITEERISLTFRNHTE